MVRSGDPIEISDGVPIYCLPTLSRGGAAQTLGAAVLQSDPAVEYAATEVGFSPKPDMLRAPDVAVLPGPPKDGWLKEAPPLAVEYADRGQDFADLRKKIGEYLEHGVLFVWVVRLDGPRRVEVYTPDGNKEVLGPGKLLLAPGVLANPVPVEALYEPGAARETVLRNVLARAGYSSLEEVYSEGKIEGKIEGEAEASRSNLMAVYKTRFGEVPEAMPAALSRLDRAPLQALLPDFVTGSQDSILALLGISAGS